VSTANRADFLTRSDRRHVRSCWPISSPH